jgi:hypothetical protein
MVYEKTVARKKTSQFCTTILHNRNCGENYVATVGELTPAVLNCTSMMSEHLATNIYYCHG